MNKRSAKWFMANFMTHSLRRFPAKNGHERSAWFVTRIGDSAAESAVLPEDDPNGFERNRRTKIG
jgi:hypothetical protein